MGSSKWWSSLTLHHLVSFGALELLLYGTIVIHCMPVDAFHTHKNPNYHVPMADSWWPIHSKHSCVCVCVFISHRSLFQICFANDNGIFEAICTTYSNVLLTNLLGPNHMICANDLRKLHKYAWYFIHYIQIQTAKYFESILIWIIGSNCGPKHTHTHIRSHRECCWFANLFTNADVYDNVGMNSIVFHTRLCKKSNSMNE